MRRPSGYLFGVGPSGVVEADTITCFHCQEIHRLKPFEQPSHCMVCDNDICDKPECHAGCRPFEREVERIERAAARRG